MKLKIVKLKIACPPDFGRRENCQSGYTRLVDFNEAISSRTEGASLKFTTGYTIIETMIAISVFLVVVIYGMGSLLSASLLHQKSEDMRSIMDNLSFIMEDMSRNLRTGNSYHCAIGEDDLSTANIPKESPGGDNCWGVAFEPAGGDPATLDDQWLYNISNDGKIWKTTRLESLSDYVELTPSEVSIDTMSGFTVLGAEDPLSGDTQQPFVTIRLSGAITYKNITTPFTLQTSVSQRLIDI